MSEREISVAVAGCEPLTFVDLQEREEHFDDDLLENIAYVRQQASTMTRHDPNARGVAMSGRWFEVLAGAAERGIAQRRELAAVFQDDRSSWQDLRAKVLQIVSSEPSGPLAVMRGQVERAISELATLVHDVRSAIDDGCGEPWRPDDKRADRGALLDAVRELGAAWRQARTDAVDATRELYFARQENAELKAEMVRDVDPVAVHEAAQVLAGGGQDDDDPDDVCDDCGEATRRRDDCDGECEHQRSAPAAHAAAAAPGLAAALESAHTVLVTDPRDWLRADRPMSWLYGLLVGFSVDVMPDVARRHGWDAGVVERLLFMHDALAAAMTPAGEE